MKFTKLLAKQRDVKGSGPARRLRRAGWVPAIIYADGKPGQMIQVREHDIEQLLRGHRGEHMLMDVEVEGDRLHKVLVKEVQHDPVTGRIIHADFHEVSMTKKLRVEVPIRLVGIPAGVAQQGGVLEHVLRTVEVECLPTDIPEYVEVDVSHLTIGHSVTVRDIKVDPTKITITTAPDLAVAAVAAPKVEEEVTAPAAEAVAAEPEVIREKKPEAEAAAEAESAAQESAKEAKEKKEKEK